MQIWAVSSNGWLCYLANRAPGLILRSCLKARRGDLVDWVLAEESFLAWLSPLGAVLETCDGDDAAPACSVALSSLFIRAGMISKSIAIAAQIRRATLMRRRLRRSPDSASQSLYEI